jgi:hypothetical protein
VVRRRAALKNKNRKKKKRQRRLSDASAVSSSTTTSVATNFSSNAGDEEADQNTAVAKQLSSSIFRELYRSLKLEVDVIREEEEYKSRRPEMTAKELHLYT